MDATEYMMFYNEQQLNNAGKEFFTADEIAFAGKVRIGKSWFIKMHLYKLIVCLLQEVMTKPNSM